MNNILLLAIAIIPVILILTFIQGKDKNKEPIGLLVKLFFAGVFSCFLVILISMLLSQIFPFMQIDISTGENSFLDVFLYSFVGVALIEEICKFAMTYALGYRHKAFDEAYDIVVYAIFVALGFAGFENILYVKNSGEIATGLFRGITAVPGHACDGLFMGYYLSLAKIAGVKKDKYEERIDITKSIFIPTVLHGIYDFCCFYGNKYIIIVFIVFVISMYIVALRRLNYVAKNNRNIFEKKPVEIIDKMQETIPNPTNATTLEGISYTNPISKTNSAKNKSEYFTIIPQQPRPTNDHTSENFRFEEQGVPYIPDFFSKQSISDAPIISKEQSAEYVPLVQEENIPIPEIPLEQLEQPTKTLCIYCGAQLTGEYCSSCGHKAK